MHTSAARPVISLRLAVPDAAAAVAWYQAALGAVELWNLGSVVGLAIDGAVFCVGQPEQNGWHSPAEIGTTTVRVELCCDDPDTVMVHALAAGASRLDDIRDHAMPWGVHRQGAFADPFGHLWLIGDKSPLSPLPR